MGRGCGRVLVDAENDRSAQVYGVIWDVSTECGDARIASVRTTGEEKFVCTEIWLPFVDAIRTWCREMGDGLGQIIGETDLDQ